MSDISVNLGTHPPPPLTAARFPDVGAVLADLPTSARPPGAVDVLLVNPRTGHLLKREYGGCAANIAYNLKALGGDPVILAAVGQDAGGLQADATVGTGDEDDPPALVGDLVDGPRHGFSPSTRG